MESAFLSAVKSGKIPGAVVIAKDLTGMSFSCVILGTDSQPARGS